MEVGKSGFYVWPKINRQRKSIHNLHSSKVCGTIKFFDGGLDLPTGGYIHG